VELWPVRGRGAAVPHLGVPIAGRYGALSHNNPLLKSERSRVGPRRAGHESGVGHALIAPSKHVGGRHHEAGLPCRIPAVPSRVIERLASMVVASIASLSYDFDHGLAEPDHATAHVFQQPTLSLANYNLRTSLDLLS
jgi:hypothetical protein